MLAETLNLTGEKLGPTAATQMLDRLIEGAHFDTVHTPKTDFNAAQSLFRRHDKLTFVDSTMVSMLSRTSLE